MSLLLKIITFKKAIPFKFDNYFHYLIKSFFHTVVIQSSLMAILTLKHTIILAFSFALVPTNLYEKNYLPIFCFRLYEAILQEIIEHLGLIREKYCIFEI